MKRIIFLHGMKRSGNHAIINWLAQQASLIIFNDVVPIGKILRGKASYPETQPFESWLKTLRFRQRLSYAFAKHLKRNSNILTSLEDCHPSMRLIEKEGFEETNIMLIRDPVQLFSSRIRKAAKAQPPTYLLDTDERRHRAVELWKSHAREFLGETDILTNRIGIYFDAWFEGQEYRQTISHALGFQFNDAGFGRVSQIGGGSSFDGTAYDGASQKMNLLDRRSQLNAEEEDLLKRVLDEPEMSDLAHRIKRQVNSGL